MTIKPNIAHKIKSMTSNRVLLRRSTEKDEVAKPGSKIVLPEQSRIQSQIAEVLAVGPGKMVKGKRQPMTLKVGDKVVVGHWASTGTKIKVNDEVLMVLRDEEDVLAIVED